jgi:ABC-type transporter Mla maintaining outer membrane lipid asymmetry ATPase subunit MlaF
MSRRPNRLVVALSLLLLGTASAVAQKYPSQLTGGFLRLAFVVAVEPNSPYKTFPELTVVMKKKGKDVTYGTASPPGIVTGDLNTYGMDPFTMTAEEAMVCLVKENTDWAEYARIAKNEPQ